MYTEMIKQKRYRRDLNKHAESMTICKRVTITTGPRLDVVTLRLTILTIKCWQGIGAENEDETKITEGAKIIDIPLARSRGEQ